MKTLRICVIGSSSVIGDGNNVRDNVRDIRIKYNNQFELRGKREKGR